MPETSRPTCQRAPWCALDPGHDDGCSIIRPITPPRFNTAGLEKAVASFLAGLRGIKTMTRTDYVLVPDSLPAVGGNPMSHALITDPSGQPELDARFDVNPFIIACRKSRETAEEYTEIAAEIGEILTRLRGLKSRTVIDPEDQEFTSPAMLRSSLVQFDMGEQVARLQRIQVATLGYAGAWSLQADTWHEAMQEALAYEADQERRAAEAALKQADVDDQVAADAEQNLDHLTVPADRVTDVVVEEAPRVGE